MEDPLFGLAGFLATPGTFTVTSLALLAEVTVAAVSKLLPLLEVESEGANVEEALALMDLIILPCALTGMEGCVTSCLLNVENCNRKDIDESTNKIAENGGFKTIFLP